MGKTCRGISTALSVTVAAISLLACAKHAGQADSHKNVVVSSTQLQAIYFPGDSLPLDKGHCGSWGQWEICFAKDPPLSQERTCAAQRLFEQCERQMITPLLSPWPRPASSLAIREPSATW
jgi:hypothetical protein